MGDWIDSSTIHGHSPKAECSTFWFSLRNFNGAYMYMNAFDKKCAEILLRKMLSQNFQKFFYEMCIVKNVHVVMCICTVVTKCALTPHFITKNCRNIK